MSVTEITVCRNGMWLMHVMIFLCCLFISHFSPLCIVAPENTPTSFCPLHSSIALPNTRHYFCTKVRKGSRRLKQRVYILGDAKHGRISVYLTKHSFIKLLTVLYIHHRRYVYCKILLKPDCIYIYIYIYIFLGILEQADRSHDPCSRARECCASANALYSVHVPSRLKLQ
jgi:hypothetical protein